MAEAVAVEEGAPLVIRDLSYAVFTMMLQSLYSCRSDLSLAGGHVGVAACLQVADFYVLAPWKAELESHLVHHVDDRSVFYLLRLSKAYNARQLRIVCLLKLARSRQKLMWSADWKQLDAEDLADLADVESACARMMADQLPQEDWGDLPQLSDRGLSWAAAGCCIFTSCMPCWKVEASAVDEGEASRWTKEAAMPPASGCPDSLEGLLDSVVIDSDDALWDSLLEAAEDDDDDDDDGAEEFTEQSALLGDGSGGDL
eukprot:PLAT11360.2.p1 GENE.PLAT11360.2~~PLAT11360.2.p1  ORF type:complete len:283 (+),score=118.79 PLAT11360.2:79-849(+)